MGDSKGEGKERGHSSAGRAPALQAGGRRFDPDWLHQKEKKRREKKKDKQKERAYKGSIKRRV